MFLCKLCRYRDMNNAEDSSNPFVLVKRTARHKVCRGCGLMKEKLSCPNDYLLGHKEKYSFFDKKNKKMKDKFGNRFYHVNIDCVKVTHPYVTTTDFTMPPELKSALSKDHFDYFQSNGLFQ